MYGTVALGATGAAVTLASGPLYAQFGAASFWAMAGLCLLALPLTAGMRLSEVEKGSVTMYDAYPTPGVSAVCSEPSSRRVAPRLASGCSRPAHPC